MPKYFAKSPPMTIVKVEIEEEFWIKNFGKKTNKKVEKLPKIFGIRKIKERAYTLAEKRETNKEAYKP